MRRHSTTRSRKRTLRTLVVIAMLATSAVVASPLQAASGGDFADRAETAMDQFGIDSEWRDALQRAIDPDDYECEPTEFFAWIVELLDSINPASLDVIFGFAVDAWPTFYSLLFDNDASDEFIGVNGEYTKEQIKRHRNFQRRFWDVDTTDVQLQAMHGSVIADDSKMVAFVSFFFDVSEAEAQFVVDLVQETIANDPTLDYNNPLFTLNAFAFSDGGEEIIPGFGLLPDKIVMGDGILVALEDLGLGTNGADLVHAHEFAHHVQFEIGAFDSPLDPPEATRRTELMADAFAAYSLAHARGAAFQTKRIVDTAEATFAVGDCQFDSPGHHGTPNQRRAAAEWGAELAQSARPQGKINSSLTMLALFDAELPNIVAPDAP